MTATTHAQRLAPLEQRHFWFAGRDVLVRRLLVRHQALEPVVDLGCGTGRFAGELAAEGRRVVAVDPEPDPALAPSGATVIGSATQIPLHDSSVGTVLMRDVLEHLDDVAALAECRRVLVSGGLLVILVPGWPSLWNARDVRAGHRRRYRRRGLRAVVSEAGFEVLRLRGYQLTLLPALAAHRWYAARSGANDATSLHHEEHPPAVLNALFARINHAEAVLATSPLPLPPTGTSLVLVARVP
jgi:SAM-dependent methyltransferase